MSDCTEIQERIALGQPLFDAQRVHLSSCERCSQVAETFSRLDASLESLAEPVPDGFADRVMSRIAVLESVRPNRWFDAHWAQLALANAALVCALVNTVRFLASVLIPSVSLGGTP
jgi:anti-sigma factor RsiW